MDLINRRTRRQKHACEQKVPTTKKTPRRGVRGLSVFLFGELREGGTGLAELSHKNTIEAT